MAWLRARLNALLQRHQPASGGGPAIPPGAPSPGVSQTPLQELGHSLEARREALGLSRRQLALDTKVSTAVLEALEQGWTDRLPEAAFLGTILQKLAQRLELPPGELERALKAALPPKQNQREMDNSGLKRFTLSSIELFSTWQGTIAYGLLLAGLVYGLNLQQRQLAAAQVFSLQPIPPSSSPPRRQANALQQLLKLYPELRPLP